MKYRVAIEGREREVDVIVNPDGGVSVSLDGSPIEADIERMPGGLSMRLGGEVLDLAVGGPGAAMHLAAGSARVTAAVESERSRAKAKKKGGLGASGKELKAPMPGRVLEVRVAVGDEVEANQPIVVIEAMKMENELRAAAAGKVAAVLVSEGQSVEAQARLVTFE